MFLEKPQDGMVIQRLFVLQKYPHSGVKRTFCPNLKMSAFDPKRISVPDHVTDGAYGISKPTFQ